MRDDSEDIAKTMAALDKALKQAGRFAVGMDRMSRRNRHANRDTDPAAEVAV